MDKLAMKIDRSTKGIVSKFSRMKTVENVTLADTSLISNLQ